jgi:hypothetical protein
MSHTATVPAVPTNSPTATGRSALRSARCHCLPAVPCFLVHLRDDPAPSVALLISIVSCTALPDHRFPAVEDSSPSQPSRSIPFFTAINQCINQSPNFTLLFPFPPSELTTSSITASPPSSPSNSTTLHSTVLPSALTCAPLRLLILPNRLSSTISSKKGKPRLLIDLAADCLNKPRRLAAAETSSSSSALLLLSEASSNQPNPSNTPKLSPHRLPSVTSIHWLPRSLLLSSSQALRWVPQ